MYALQILLIFLSTLCYSDLSAREKNCCTPTCLNESRILNQRLDRVEIYSDECPGCATCTTGCVLPGDPACQSDCRGRTIFIPRSVGANTAREMVGWQTLIHRVDTTNCYLSVANATGYARSFRPERLAHILFGNNVIKLSGSQVPQRARCEWLADYFGLSTTYQGTLTFKPIIENIFCDTEIFVGLDGLASGLYLRTHLPLVHTRWSLNACECSSTESQEIPAAYMSQSALPSAPSAQTALNGTFAFGDQQQPRHYANINFCPQHLTKLADVDLILGWDFWKCSNYYLGIYAIGVAPTGNKPNPRYLFSPLVGNTKRWEVGAGAAGFLLLWERDVTMTLAVYFDGQITHMFASEQCRTFDLKKRAFSRYMLAKEFESDGFTYAGTIVPVADITTLRVKASVPIKGDLSVKLAYRHECGIDVDLGYNFYGHAAEHLKLCQRSLAGNYGLKGTQGVYYNEYATTGADFGPFVQELPLNSTQSRATVHRGALVDNPDIPSSLTTGDVGTAWNSTRITGPASGPDLVIAKESNPPVLLSIDDLNLCSGKACSYITNKLFFNAGYTAENFCRSLTGFIGVGGEIEVEAQTRNLRTALNQWSIWVKGGLSY